MVEEQKELFKEKGGTWQLNLQPHDTLTIAVNEVIAKTITPYTWTTVQLKTWEALQKK